MANGQYVANMCIGCHGADLSGGKIPGGPPDWPAAADIRPGAGSAMARYPNAASFVAMLRTGKRPDGTPIQVMPFESLGQLSDVDAQALYLYLTAPGGVAKAGGSGAAGAGPAPAGAEVGARGSDADAHVVRAEQSAGQPNRPSNVPSVSSGLRMPG